MYQSAFLLCLDMIPLDNLHLIKNFNYAEIRLTSNCKICSIYACIALLAIFHPTNYYLIKKSLLPTGFLVFVVFICNFISYIRRVGKMYFYCIKNMCMASVEELINNYLWHSMIIHMLCYPKLEYVSFQLFENKFYHEITWRSLSR